MTRARLGRLACLSVLVSACADQGTPGVPPTGPVPINNARLVYPKALEALGIEGSTWAECNVTSAGTTEDCHVLTSTDPRFDASTLAYVNSARYQPATRNGVPVRAEHHVFQVNYVMHRDGVAPMTTRYACAVDRFGSVRSCAVIGKNLPFMASVTQAITSSRFVPSVVDGKAVADPARRIDVAMSITSYPDGVMAPLPPSDMQIDVYMSCRSEADATFTEQRPHCTRISPADLSSVDPSDGARIMRISIGFSGLVPSSRGSAASPPGPPALDAKPPARREPAVSSGPRLG